MNRKEAERAARVFAAGRTAGIPFSRRRWLKTSAAALAPFLPFSVGRTARAAEPRKKRLVLLFSPNGTIYNNWKPSGGTSDFKLSPILAPLEPLRKKIIILNGLQKKSQGGDNHQVGMAKTWTGSTVVGSDFGSGPLNKALASGISIDQAVAQGIAADVAAAGSPPLRFKSLEFGVQTTINLGPAWLHMIYSGPGVQKPSENDPYAMFDRLFAGTVGMDQQTLDQIRAEDRSVIDRVKGDLTALSKVVGAADRRKLEEHLTSIRAIEGRLATSAPVSTCDPSLVRAAVTNKLNIRSNDNFPALVKLTSDILVLALKCDLTRVASIQWSVSVGNQTHKWSGAVPAANAGHHSSSHDDGAAEHIAYLTRVNTWYAQQMAYLLAQLDAVQEDGFTLLDNCLVAYGNELGAGGPHSITNIPFVLAGGAGGAITPGKFLTFTGELHNRMLLSMGQVMGLNITKFGTDDNGKGPLPGLL